MVSEESITSKRHAHDDVTTSDLSLSAVYSERGFGRHSLSLSVTVKDTASRELSMSNSMSLGPDSDCDQAVLMKAKLFPSQASVFMAQWLESFTSARKIRRFAETKAIALES